MVKKMKKYPRTYHLPFSPEVHSDDKLCDISDVKHIIDEKIEVVISEKLDGGACLAFDTIVETEDGPKTIQEVHETKYRGRVESFNTETGENEFKAIIDSFSNGVGDDWYELEDDKGNLIKVTGEHLVYLPELECYRKVKNLQEGDKILLKS